MKRWTTFWSVLLGVNLLILMITGTFWLPVFAGVAASVGVGYELGRATSPRSLER